MPLPKNRIPLKAVDRSFFQHATPVVAKRLLGSYLVHNSPEGRTVGRIVETEAYLSVEDAASHSHRGKTKRNAAMFERPGTVYIYFIYGNHFCLNVVTAPEGCGEAALVRALEPVEGIELMMKRRGTSQLRNLCNGPGKLVQAMGIGKEQNGASLLRGPLKIVRSASKTSRGRIVASGRIGISRAGELPLRFYIHGNEFVSR